jgi:endonuclease/exonuclease/phosphatase family metal-dependent hydrolase
MDAKGRTAGRGGQTFRLRILSYNIHQGLTIHKRRIAITKLKEAIKALRADIVLLQEVAGVNARHVPAKGGRITSFQLEAFADEIWPYHAYGRNAVFAGGFHGNAILSKFPIVRWDNVDISVKLVRRGLVKMLPKRGMLHAEIELPDRGVSAHILGTHFGLLQYERHRQLKQLCTYIRSEIPIGSPFVVAGDFNDWREMITRKLARQLHTDEAYLSHHRRHARTFPARFPVLCLDRIYYRGFELHSATRLAGKPWLFLSDHLPLMADFIVP